MAQLGHERFSVVGHDRGGRVAYRMAIDHPDAVERLGVLNIVPTGEQFERMAADASLDYYPWFLLAQPPPFAERVVSARRMDASDRERGHKIQCPVLVHWGAEEGAMSDGPLDVWRRWAGAVEGGPLPSGHFIPEEAPSELAASLQSFLDDQNPRRD